MPNDSLESPTARVPGARRTPIWPAAALSLVFAVAAMLVIFSGTRNGRAASDMINYHEPAVRAFAGQWPWFDFSNYLSATTPGYHVLLATVARWASDDAAALQCAGLMFGVGLIALLAMFVGRRAGAGAGLILTAPTAASLYVFVSGSFLLPDNAGWLGVLLVLVLSLKTRQTWVNLSLAGLTLAALVFTRQIHLWAAAPIWAAAFFNPPGANAGGMTLARRLIAAGVALAFTLPAFAVVGFFFKLWGGLTPPMFKEFHSSGINPAAPAFILAMIGGFGVVFVRWWWPGVRELHRGHRVLLPAVVLAALVLSMVPTTTYDQMAGRWAGVVWDVSRKMPTILGRTSPLLLVLAPLGAVILAGLLHRVSHRGGGASAGVLIVALLAFTAAQAASFQLWQRYNEPFVLMFLALASALASEITARDTNGAGSRGEARDGAVSCAPQWLPMAMAVGFALVTGWKVTHDAPAGIFDVLNPSEQRDMQKENR